MYIQPQVTKKVNILIDAKPAERLKYEQVAEDIRTAKIEVERTPLTDTQTREDLAQLIGELETELEDVAREVKKGIATLTLTSLTRYEYMSILKEHLPREGDPLDAQLGYNTDTFGGALLRKVTVKAVDGNGDPLPRDCDTWLDDKNGVPAPDFEAWFRTAMSLQTKSAANFPH